MPIKFNLSVSTTESKSKPTEKDIARMRYRKQSIDIDTFINYVREGRTFCYCFDDMDEAFGNRTKTQNKFRYTNVIAIDVDDSTLPITEYVNSLTYKPTVAYTTYSNKVKGYRFRLVYVFTDKIIGVENYATAYNGILSANGMALVDNCMKSVSQCFIGNGSKDVEIINSGRFYSKNDFAFESNTPSPSLYNIHSKCKNGKGDAIHRTSATITLDPTFAHDLYEMRPSDFISKYGTKYRYFDRNSLILSEDCSHYIFPDDYREIKRKWEMKEIITRQGERKNVRAIHKNKDGERRRKKLFDAAAIMKAIKPDITMENLVYNLCVERYYYHDNSDKQLSNGVLISIAQNAMKGDYKPQPSEHGQFKVNKTYWAEMGYNAHAAARKVSKMLNYQSIGEWYDCGKSVRENAEYAAANGIKKAKMRTLYNWCKENGIPYQGINAS